MGMRSTVAALLMSTLLGTTLAQAAAPARLDSVFQDIKAGTPGCSASAMRNGKVEWSGGFGTAVVESRPPNTPDTVFNMASVSKQFTAFAILQLEADGKLRLDEPIRKYLPELPAYTQDVTIQNLLHHTGGLQDYLQLAELSGFKLSQRLTREQAYDLVVRQNAAMFPAGIEFNYSNTGYFLLSMIIERVSGQTFKTYAEAHIFKPLGMTRSTIVDYYPFDWSNVAQGYERDDKSKPFAATVSVWEPTGDGQVYTNIRDIMLWLHNLETGRVGGKAVIDKMRQTMPLADGDPNRYAMGLGIGQYRGLHQIAHSGGWAGNNTYVAIYPTKALAVAVFCNSYERDASDRAHRLVDLLLGAGKAPLGPEHITLPPSIAAAAKEGVGSALPGTYVDDAGRIFALRRTKSGLMFDMFAATRPLVQRPDRILALEEDDGSFYLVPTPDGRIVSSNPASTYRRVAPWTPRDITAYAGSYVLETTPGRIEIVARQGMLQGRIGEKSFTLTPIAPERFKTGELGVLSFTADKTVVTSNFAPNLRFRRAP